MVPFLLFAVLSLLVAGVTLRAVKEKAETEGPPAQPETPIRIEGINLLFLVFFVVHLLRQKVTGHASGEKYGRFLMSPIIPNAIDLLFP